jgi:hypothetical protein
VYTWCIGRQSPTGLQSIQRKPSCHTPSVRTMSLGSAWRTLVGGAATATASGSGSGNKNVPIRSYSENQTDQANIAKTDEEVLREQLSRNQADAVNPANQSRQKGPGRFTVAIPPKSYKVAVNGLAEFQDPESALDAIAFSARSICLFPVRRTAVPVSKIDRDSDIDSDSDDEAHDSTRSVSTRAISKLRDAVSVRRLHLTGVHTEPASLSILRGMTRMQTLKLTRVELGNNSTALTVPDRETVQGGAVYVQELAIYNPQDTFRTISGWFWTSPGLHHITSLRLFTSANPSSVPDIDQLTAWLDACGSIEDLAIDQVNVASQQVLYQSLVDLARTVSKSLKRLYITKGFKVPGQAANDLSVFVPFQDNFGEVVIPALASLEVLHLGGLGTLNQTLVTALGHLTKIKCITLESAEEQGAVSSPKAHDWQWLFGIGPNGWNQKVLAFRMMSPLTSIISLSDAIRGNPFIEELVVAFPEAPLLSELFTTTASMKSLGTIGIRSWHGFRVPQDRLEEHVRLLAGHQSLRVIWIPDEEYVYDLNKALKAAGNNRITVVPYETSQHNPSFNW